MFPGSLGPGHSQSGQSVRELCNNMLVFVEHFTKSRGFAYKFTGTLSVAGTKCLSVQALSRCRLHIYLNGLFVFWKGFYWRNWLR
jgi:hypothetical protein